MATTSPASPTGAPPPPPGDRPPAPLRPRPPPSMLARSLAAGALGLVVLVIAYLIFSGGGGANYHLLFASAGQLVRGDQVQVGGVPVGSVTNIELTKRFKALVTIHVESSLTPLHLGTSAIVRVPSLATVADRYIELSPGPNSNPSLQPGTTLPASATREVVDLDQLFNTLNPATRRGLQEVIQGFAEQFAGASRAYGQSVEYFPAATAATDHFFHELVLDQPVFTHFLVETAKAVTTIGGRSEQLTDLIGNADTTFDALGSQQEDLAQGLKELPVALRAGTQAFVGIPPTFAKLSTLIEASKPTSKPLNTLFTRLRPLLVTATPVVSNFALAFSRPGPNNDLTEFANTLPALAKELTTASPATVTTLRESIPITAFFGPYSPDLEGTLRTFGQAGAYYDANGHYVRISPIFPDFKLGSGNNLTPASLSQALEGILSNQLRRCPGAATQPAADGSSPFTDWRPAQLRPDGASLMNPRRGGSLAGSPLLIGAITTLIVVVAVYLSYNANNGLPFVPTYKIKVELPEASGLESSNQVRVGGSRVGVIEKMTAHLNPTNGKVTAIASLKLEKSAEPLPVDTKAIVLSVSSIGLKYLQLEKGISHRELKDGQTIPVSQVREPVNIEEFFNMFNAKTRTANKINLNNYGDGLAGRGPGINNTIATLRPLVTNAIPVLRNLAAPATGLREFFIALERYNEQTAAVAIPQANFYRYLDTFFTAWAGVAPYLERATVLGPPSLQQAIHSLPFEANFQEKQTEAIRLLRPSAKLLVSVGPPLAHAISVGAVNLRSATELNRQLAASQHALAEFTQNPIVPVSLEDLTETLGLANPLLAGLAPMQATCNYLTLAFRNLASLESENVGVGTVARSGIVLNPNGPNNEGLPSSAPANGPSVEHPFGSTAIINNNHLHANPYPNVSGPGQPQGNCEAGNETYIPGQLVVGHVPGATGTVHELTTRNESLFGEKYPSSVLKNLGLPTGEKKSGGEQMSRARWWRRYDQVPASQLGRKNPVRYGIVLIVIILIGVYFGFTKHIPFKHSFRLNAVFSTAVNIRPTSPVRIAGVNVGKVTGVSREGNAGLVIDGSRKGRTADPLRRDGQDPPAHVLGRQLVRRTEAGQSLGQHCLLGLHDPDHPDSRSGPARSGARRAEHRHAPEPAELPDRLRQRADAQAERGRQRRTGTGSAGLERRAGAQPLLPARAGRAARHARCSTRRSAAPRRTTSQNSWKASARSPPR